MTDLIVAPTLLPAQNLRDVTRNCDEDQPLEMGDPRWQDFAPVRGDHAIGALRKELEWRPPNKFVHAAFVSHRGAGKSTEILRLVASLSDSYFPVYLAATVEMDPFQIDAEDLLFNLAMAVAARLQEKGLALPSHHLKKVVSFFDEVIRTTKWGKSVAGQIEAGAEAKSAIPFVGGLFSSIKALLKQESEYRTEVKQVLKKYPGTLLESVNQLLDAANELLGRKSLLLIIDNLDRYKPEVIDDLLVKGSDRIRQLRCNLILTPPIGLLLRPQSQQLDSLYSCHFLFTVRLRKPDQGYREFDGPGRELMEKALALRMNLDVVMPDRAARDRLIAASGGAIRELLELVSAAAFLTEGEAITLADVEQALARRRQRMRDLINANAWLEALVRLARDKQIFPEKACLDLLFHRLAFKYNGDGWYDIHPLVAELPEFVSASSAAGKR